MNKSYSPFIPRIYGTMKKQPLPDIQKLKFTRILLLLGLVRDRKLEIPIIEESLKKLQNEPELDNINLLMKTCSDQELSELADELIKDYINSFLE